MRRIIRVYHHYIIDLKFYVIIRVYLREQCTVELFVLIRLKYVNRNGSYQHSTRPPKLLDKITKWSMESWTTKTMFSRYSLGSTTNWSCLIWWVLWPSGIQYHVLRGLFDPGMAWNLQWCGLFRICNVPGIALKQNTNMIIIQIVQGFNTTIELWFLILQQIAAYRKT